MRILIVFVAAAALTGLAVTICDFRSRSNRSSRRLKGLFSFFNRAEPETRERSCNFSPRFEDLRKEAEAQKIAREWKLDRVDTEPPKRGLLSRLFTRRSREEMRERSCNSSPRFQDMEKESEAQKIGSILGLDSESELLKVEDKHLLDFWEHIFGKNSRTPNQEQLREMLRVPSDKSFTDEQQWMWKCKWNEWRRVRFLKLLGPQFFNPVELNLDNGSVQVRFVHTVVRDYRRLFRNGARSWDYFEERFLKRAQVSVTKSSIEGKDTTLWEIRLKPRFLEAFLTEYKQYRDQSQDRKPVDPLLYLKSFVEVVACPMRSCKGKGCGNCLQTGFKAVSHQLSREDEITLSERQQTQLRDRVNQIEKAQKFIGEQRTEIQKTQMTLNRMGILKRDRPDRRKAQAPRLPPIQALPFDLKLPAEST